MSFEKGVWAQEKGIYRLQHCPTGHKVINSSLLNAAVFSHDAQTCQVCGKGEECKLSACVTCSPCPAGTFKAAEGTEECSPCPVNRYREDPGAQQLSDCEPCPEGSDTGGLQGQATAASCKCSGRFYLTQSSSGPGCSSCPPGGMLEQPALELALLLLQVIHGHAESGFCRSVLGFLRC